MIECGTRDGGCSSSLHTLLSHVQLFSKVREQVHLKQELLFPIKHMMLLYLCDLSSARSPQSNDCVLKTPPPKKTFSGASLQNSPVCDPGFSIVLYIFVAISGKTKSFGINKVLLHLFFCYFFHFKTSCHLLQLFRRMLQHWFAVKLQKCFVNYETFNQYASE